MDSTASKSCVFGRPVLKEINENNAIQQNSKAGKKIHISPETAALEEQKGTIIVNNEEICVKSCSQLNGESCQRDQEIKTPGTLPDIVNVQPVIISTGIDDKDTTITSVLNGLSGLHLDTPKGEHTLSVPTLNLDGISSDDESFADCATYTDHPISSAYNIAPANNSAVFVNNLISSIEGSIEDAIKHFDNFDAFSLNANQEFVIDSTTLSVDLENTSMVDDAIEKNHENVPSSSIELNSTWINPNSTAFLEGVKAQSISEFATPNTTINLNTTLDEVSTTFSGDLQNILTQETSGNDDVPNSNNEAISTVSIVSNTTDSKEATETCETKPAVVDEKIRNNENVLSTNHNDNNLESAAGTATLENQSDGKSSSELVDEKKLNQDATNNNANANLNENALNTETNAVVKKNIGNLTSSKSPNANNNVDSINNAILGQPEPNIPIVNVVGEKHEQCLPATKPDIFYEGQEHIENGKIISGTTDDISGGNDEKVKINNDVITTDTNFVSPNTSSSYEAPKENIKKDNLNETIDIKDSTNTSNDDENILNKTHDVADDCANQNLNINSHCPVEELNSTYGTEVTVNINDCIKTEDFNETFTSNTRITQFHKDVKGKDSPLNSTASVNLSTEVPLVAEKILPEAQCPNISLEAVTPAENISQVPHCFEIPVESANQIENIPHVEQCTELRKETGAPTENITSVPPHYLNMKEVAVPSENVSEIVQSHDDIPKEASKSLMDMTHVFDNSVMNPFSSKMSEKISTILPFTYEPMDIDELSLESDDSKIRKDEDLSKNAQDIFIGNLLTDQINVTFKTPSINVNSGTVSKRQASDKDFFVKDEDFEGNGLILNPSDFDYLLTKGNNSQQIDDRSSLLLRFDPLLGHALPVNNFENNLDPNPSNKRLPKNRGRLSPAIEEEEANKLLNNTSTGSALNIITPVECKSNKQEEIHQDVPYSELQVRQEAPLPIHPVAKNNLLPCIKKDDKMSVDVIQDIQIENDVKSAANVNSQTDEKQDYKMDDLEKKIKNEVLKTEDIEKKLKDAEQREEALLKRITEKDKTIVNMSGVIEAYEKAITELIVEKEQIIQNFEKQMDEIKSDRDLNYQHLTSLESTFSDLHVKYERSKQLTAKLEASEESLRAEKKQNLENLRLQEVRYEKMKSHAMQQLEIANNKLESLTKEHTIEITRLRALLKKEEIARLSLNEQLQQKTRENGELMKICDELINGQGASS